MPGFTPKKLSPRTITAPGVYYSEWINPQNETSIGFQVECLGVSGVTGTVGLDVKAHETASPCVYQIGGTDFSEAIANSTASFDGGTGVLDFASASATLPLDGVVIQFVDGGTAGAETVTLTDDLILVEIESGVSTAAQIKTALDAEVGTFLTTTVDTGGAVDAGFTKLAGGSQYFDLETAVPYIRLRVEVTAGTAGTIQPYFNGKS